MTSCACFVCIVMHLRLGKLFIIPFYVLRTYFYVVMPIMLCNVSLNTPITCSLVRFPGMTSSLAIVNKSLSCAFSIISYSLMFLNIQIDLLILKTYYGQFTLTTKKSLHIIFNRQQSLFFMKLSISCTVNRKSNMYLDFTCGI